jgi:hypothetical protein
MQMPNNFRVILETAEGTRMKVIVTEKEAMDYVTPLRDGTFLMPNGLRYETERAESALNHGARFAAAAKQNVPASELWWTHADRIW